VNFLRDGLNGTLVLGIASQSEIIIILVFLLNIVCFKTTKNNI
jgi:hypothetical protein